MDNLLVPTLSLILIPLYLKKLGATEFGVWLLFSSIGSLVGALNAGMGEATTKFLSSAQAKTNSEKSELFQQSIGLALFFTLGSALFVSLLVITLPLDQWLNLTMHSKSTMWALSLLALGQFSLKQMEGVLLAPYKAELDYAKACLMSASHKVILLFTQIIILINGGKVLNLMQLTTLVSFIVVMIEAIIVYQTRSFLLKKFSISLKQSRDHYRYGGQGVLQSTLGVLTGQLDKIFVNIVSGPALFSYYSIGSQISGQLHLIFVAATSWLLPLFSQAENSFEKQDELFSNSLKFLLGIGIPLYLFCLLIFPHLIPIWLGVESYENSWPFIKGFLIYGSIILVTIPGHYFFMGTNRPEMGSLYVSTASALGILGMLFFWKQHGNLGLIQGKIIGLVFVVSIQQCYLFHKFLKNSNPWKRTLLTLGPIYLMVMIYFSPLTSLNIGLSVLLISWVLYRLNKLRNSILGS